MSEYCIDYFIRKMRTWSPVLFVILAVFSAALELHAQSPTPPAKREGSFLLKGTLVNAAKAPLGGWTVMVSDLGVGDDRQAARFPQLRDERFSLNESGLLIYRGYAGEGTTGPDGHFEFPVSKAYFKGREITFRLFAMGPDKGVHEPIKTKEQDGSEVEAVFKADEAAKTVDLLKMTGKPIVLRR